MVVSTSSQFHGRIAYEFYKDILDNYGSYKLVLEGTPSGDSETKVLTSANDVYLVRIDSSSGIQFAEGVYYSLVSLSNPPTIQEIESANGVLITLSGVVTADIEDVGKVSLYRGSNPYVTQTLDELKSISQGDPEILQMLIKL